MPVTRNDQERKLVMVDMTSILGVRQLSIRGLGRPGIHHSRSTIYLFGKHRDEGGEREGGSDGLAPKQYVEQGLVGYLTRTDVANDGECISEEENEESRGDNKDSVDVQEVID